MKIYIITSVGIIIIIIVALLLRGSYSQKNNMQSKPMNPPPIQWDEIKTRLGASATAKSGVTIALQELVEDSRCPEGVNCYWPGTVKVKVHVSKNDAGKDYILVLANKVQTSYGNITLSAVQPNRRNTDSIDHDQYLFVFRVQY